MYLCLEGFAALTELAAEPNKYSVILQGARGESGAIPSRCAACPRGIYPALSITPAGAERGGTFKTAALFIHFPAGEVASVR